MRTLVRWFGTAIAAAVLATAAGATALAGTVWCVEDPTIYVDGRQLVLTTMFDAAYTADASLVSYEVQVPSNTRVRVVYDKAPVPEKVTVSYTLSPQESSDSYQVVVKVTVFAGSSFKTRTTVTGTNVDKEFTVEAKSNTVATFKVKLNP